MAEPGHRDADVESLAQDIMVDDYYSSEKQVARGRAAIEALVRLCREARDERDRERTAWADLAGKLGAENRRVESERDELHTICASLDNVAADWKAEKERAERAEADLASLRARIAAWLEGDS